MPRSSFWEPPEDLDPTVIEDSFLYGCVTKKPSQPVQSGVKEIKKWLKLYGGRGYTEHYERDGTMFEVTSILLEGDNSTHKYNHHL